MRLAAFLLAAGRVPSFVVNKVTSMQPMRVEKLRELVEAEYRRALQDATVMDAIEAMPIPMPPNLNPEPEQETPSPTDIPSVPSSPPDLPSAQTNAVKEELSGLPKSGGGDTFPVAMANGDSPNSDNPDGSIKAYTPLQSMNESDTENGDGTLTLQPIGENPVFGNIPWKYEPGSVRGLDGYSASAVAALLRLTYVCSIPHSQALWSLSHAVKLPTHSRVSLY